MTKAQAKPTEQVVVTPVLPGFLMMSQIATLAGVKTSTMRGYSATGAAGMPDPASRSGATPLWAVDDIIKWLGERPQSQTILKKKSNGSIVVEKRSDYQARKDRGESLSHRKA